MFARYDEHLRANNDSFFGTVVATPFVVDGGEVCLIIPSPKSLARAKAAHDLLGGQDKAMRAAHRVGMRLATMPEVLGSVFYTGSRAVVEKMTAQLGHVPVLGQLRYRDRLQKTVDPYRHCIFLQYGHYSFDRCFRPTCLDAEKTRKLLEKMNPRVQQLDALSFVLAENQTVEPQRAMLAPGCGLRLTHELCRNDLRSKDAVVSEKLVIQTHKRNEPPLPHVMVMKAEQRLEEKRRERLAACSDSIAGRVQFDHDTRRELLLRSAQAFGYPTQTQRRREAKAQCKQSQKKGLKHRGDMPK